MGMSSKLSSAALVSVVAVFLITVILVPDGAWSLTTIASCITLAASVGAFFYQPVLISNIRSNSNSKQLAAIGPLGAVTATAIIIAGASFALSGFGYEKFALVGVVLSVSITFIGWQIISAGLNQLEVIVESDVVPSRHFEWQMELAGVLPLVKDSDQRKSLETLKEKIRFSSSDPLRQIPINEDISSAVQRIVASADSDNPKTLLQDIAAIEVLLVRREAIIRSGQSSV